MKIFKMFLILTVILSNHLIVAQFNFQRSWGTYFADERFYFTDSAIDIDGNLYVLGTIEGSNILNLPIFTSINSYHQYYGGGDTDGFVVKFNPEGNLLWGSFLGGNLSDNAMAITVDKQNNVYIVGDTNSTSEVASLNAFQQNLAGGKDIFITKFNETGVLIWSTYYGGVEDDKNLADWPQFNSFVKRTHIALSDDGYLYISSGSFSNELGSFNVFQIDRGISNCFLSKFDQNGSKLWTTYYGINTHIASLEVNNNAIYVSGYTLDCAPSNTYNTYYGTSNSFKPLPSNCRDLFLTKFSTSGQREWSTYYGGSSSEFISSNSISLKDDKIYLSGTSSNYFNNEIATPNTYQSNCNGVSNFVAQFNQDGTRNWGTYNGNFINNQSSIGLSNVYVESSDVYYNFGTTGLVDISTDNSFKTNLTNNFSQDGFVCKFNGNIKVWGTYYGGEGREFNVKFHPYDNGTKFYIVGVTTSLNEIATSNGLQPNKQIFDTNNNTLLSVNNIFVTHFEPNPLDNNDFVNSSFSIYPNPNKGIFTISINNNNFKTVALEVYDILAKKILNQDLIAKETSIKTDNLAKGVYFAKIITSENEVFTKKIVVE